LARKKKPKAPVHTTWPAYWLPGRRPFEDARWLRRWLRLKEELQLKLAR
jgi:hypothetical protein